MIGLDWLLYWWLLINIYIAGFHNSGKLFQYFISAPVLILICKKTFCTFVNRYLKWLKRSVGLFGTRMKIQLYLCNKLVTEEVVGPLKRQKNRTAFASWSKFNYFHFCSTNGNISTLVIQYNFFIWPKVVWVSAMKWIGNFTLRWHLSVNPPYLSWIGKTYKDRLNVAVIRCLSSTMVFGTDSLPLSL